MNLLVRTLIFVSFAVATVASCFLLSSAKTNPVAGVVAWLPSEKFGFEVNSGAISDEERKWLPSDTTFVKRVYKEAWRGEREANLRALNATLIVAGSDSRSLHRPQVCLTAQRWTIEKREVVPLQTEGGPLEVMDFHLSQSIRNEDGRSVLDARGKPMLIRAHYVYWWIGPDATTPSDEKRVWLELWNSILKGRKERWAYPSVMVYVDERDERSVTQERAYEFIREYAPKFQKSLGAVERNDAVELKSFGKE